MDMEYVGSLHPSRSQPPWPTLTQGVDLTPCNSRVCPGEVRGVPTWGQQGCMASLTVTCTPASPCVLVAL